ncbi:STAS-like domain-containing protein [Vibrio splendidus]|uniref:STAS-like domain-containing protein n=1 Tax=Vibrio splendidus TaxID=29497 RepID=UPI00037A3EDB|nr:STAS-like domain-containing protein [Vibrio splendidus]
MISIDVTEFSKEPFGRYATDSDFHGERFRNEVLKSKLPQPLREDVVVDFTRISLGVGSSFLEEAFGGLVRDGFDKDELRQYLKIKDRMGIYHKQVMHFIEVA